MKLLVTDLEEFVRDHALLLPVDYALKYGLLLVAGDSPAKASIYLGLTPHQQEMALYFLKKQGVIEDG